MTLIQSRLNPNTTLKIAYDGEAGIEKPQFIVAYWSIRGLGAALRMMLSAAEVNHWVILYDVAETEDGGWDKESYLRDKLWLKEEYNSLINLPFLVDCRYDRVIAQTNAIFSYLGRELNMMGSGKHEQSKCEELLCEVMDLRNLMVRFAYRNEVFAGTDDAKQLVKEAAYHLDKFEEHLAKEGSNNTEREKRHLVGGNFSAPDFHLFEMLDQFEGLFKTYDLSLLWNTSRNGQSILRPYLSIFKKEFGDLRENSAYLSSFLAKLPYNNPYARFGSDPSTLGKYTRGQEAPWRNMGIVLHIRSTIKCDEAQTYQDESERKRKLDKRGEE